MEGGTTTFNDPQLHSCDTCSAASLGKSANLLARLSGDNYAYVRLLANQSCFPWQEKHDADIYKRIDTVHLHPH
jgi:hypothetical protein